MSVLPEGPGNPNYPSNFNPEQEHTDLENAVDAMYLLAVAKRVGDIEAFLDSLKPGTVAQDATYDAHDMAQNLQAHLIESAQAVSPETYRDWCRLEANKGPVQLFDEIQKIAGGE